MGRCAISGLDESPLLRASHALPWALATDAERLDIFNGLLLTAHLDAAFDSGLLAIDEELTPDERKSRVAELGEAERPLLIAKGALARHGALDWDGALF